MRRLADRSLYLGIRLCVFLVLLLFGMTLSLREAEAGTELRISPEFFVEVNALTWTIRYFIPLRSGK